MKIRTVLAVGAALLWAPIANVSFAQEVPDAQEKSADQIVCELAETCATAPAATPGAADPAAPVGPHLRAREAAATRGFSIARSSIAPAPTSAGSRPAQMSASRATAQLAGSGHSNAGITFVPGSAMLTEQGKRQALQFLGALKNPLLASKKFEVNGYTDASGSPASNRALSQRRAQAVVDFLVSKGANRAQLEAHGYGSDKLLDPSNPSSMANRRVEFVRK
jgi:outer membrane protein OmpA-like peptidoglycan-associated protein